RRVVASSQAIVVHSEYARRAALAAVPTASVTVIPHLVMPRPVMSSRREKARHRLGFSESAFVVVSPGLATVEKRLDVVLDAFARLRTAHPPARFVAVGASGPGHDVAAMIRQRRLEGLAYQTGRVALETFEAYLDAADVVVNLRYPTSGETSGAVLRALAAGRATIVSDVGSFAEIPDDSCLRVPVGNGEVDALTRALVQLADDPSLAERLGNRAREIVCRAHAPDTVVDRYLHVLRVAAGYAEASSV
ncbi:MAG TPA: glycosyltransferase family 4 protein, partial [Chloroflexota bacterium]|nr:glycosyltransferase family 4 protein [Chloroflexota bacterium]